MPSTLPSSFASAAAGNNGDASSSRNSSRPDGTGLSDWTRRSNGATQTFRRTSLITSPANPQTSRDTAPNTSSSQTSNTSAYIPPHISANRNGGLIDTRYAKSQLLELFRIQQESGDLSDGLSDLYVGEQESNFSNGLSSTRWTRREEQLGDVAGPEVCWDQDGNSIPMGLVELTEEDKVLFSTSVNSSLKPPGSGMTKDGGQRDGTLTRKMSASQGSSQNMYGLSSPSASKPGNRRRDTSESYPFPRDLASPSVPGRSTREDAPAATPPSTYARKRMELKESGELAGEDDENRNSGFGSHSTSNPPFGNLKRTMTGPSSVSQTELTSPWPNAPQSAGLAAMGAFGSFALGGSGVTSITSEKRSGLSTRGESRFRGLMGRDSMNDSPSAIRSKSSMNSLNKVEEGETRADSPGGPANMPFRPKSNDTDPFPDTNSPFGSAALGGGYDMSPAQAQRNAEYGTPVRQRFQEDHSFAAFGMTSDTRHYPDHIDRRTFDQFSSHTFQNQQAPGASVDEPMSPTFTNPYQSPEQAAATYDENDSKRSTLQDIHLPGLGGLGTQTGSSSLVGASSTSYEPRFTERTQPLSAGPNRGFPSLSGLGALAGLGGSGPWSSIPQTSSRDRGHFAEAFGDTLRSPVDLQSPNTARLGSAGPGPGGPGTIGRGSRMGSLFPQAMQEQMRSSEYPRQIQDDAYIETETRAESPSHPPISHPFGSSKSGRDDQARGSDEFFGLSETSRNIHDPSSLKPDASISSLNQSYSPAPAQAQSQLSSVKPGFNQQAAGMASSQRLPPSVGSPSSNPLPAAQQKTMVMPDRIRWIYRDPQGNTQGPWSGLEMHDWYKAGFFLPELLVKKVEDPDYEPLAQLIRRIGNSREPFLVPQIGIPGPPSTQAGSNWPSQTTTASGGPASSSVAQPPFASSFPSFGTTLTAEQQNALERRKQEEQYLMARQKEHLAQQQVLAKMQLQGPHGMHSQQLHHHSSAHSLHSQPSHGSIASPNGYQAPPMPGPTHTGGGLPNFFDNSFRPGGPTSIPPDSLTNIKEEESVGLYERLNSNPTYVQDASDAALQRQQQYEDALSEEQRRAISFSGRADLQREQAEQDILQRQIQDDGQFHKDRLQQFQGFRTEMDDPVYQNTSQGEQILMTGPAVQSQSHQASQNLQPRDNASIQAPTQVQPSKSEQPQLIRNLTLTEQVQKAASAKHTASAGPQSPWTKMESQILPPPQSSSPLPAPAAQRNRQHVADALTAESLSQSASSVETPNASLAPWAKEPAESQKNPSLKEIQEAEARKAAKREEIASAARRAALEREMSIQPVPVAPGLPSSSTWANNDSPTTPSTSAASAWIKPLAGNLPAAPTTSAKKTLQQIQQEEVEALARKKKTMASNGAAANAVVSAAQALSSGKRYADLAGKAAVPSTTTGGAWTTVGASGKAKSNLPSGPSAARSASNSASGSAASISRSKPPLTTTRSSSLIAAQQNAHEEFKKWAVVELRPDLSKGIHVDEFVQTLLSLPPELEIITEAVHGVSQTMDSRHFAEEFIRRRKLAEKGVVDSAASSGSPSNQASETKSGGWSEVAKKGPAAPQKDEGNSFKVVAAKKKSIKK